MEWEVWLDKGKKTDRAKKIIRDAVTIPDVMPIEIKHVDGTYTRGAPVNNDDIETHHAHKKSALTDRQKILLKEIEDGDNEDHKNLFAKKLEPKEASWESWLDKGRWDGKFEQDINNSINSLDTSIEEDEQRTDKIEEDEVKSELRNNDLMDNKINPPKPSKSLFHPNITSKLPKYHKGVEQKGERIAGQRDQINVEILDSMKSWESWLEKNEKWDKQEKDNDKKSKINRTGKIGKKDAKDIVRRTYDGQTPNKFMQQVNSNMAADEEKQSGSKHRGDKRIPLTRVRTHTNQPLRLGGVAEDTPIGASHQSDHQLRTGRKEQYIEPKNADLWKSWLDKNNGIETDHKKEDKHEWDGKFSSSTIRDDAKDEKSESEEESLEELTDGELVEIEKLKSWEIFLEKGDGGHFSRPSKIAEKPKLVGHNKPVYTTFDGSREVQNDDKQVRGKGVGTPHIVNGVTVARGKEDVTVSNTIPTPKKDDVSTSKKLDSLTPEKVQEHQSNISSDNAQLPDNHPDKMNFSTRDVGVGSWNKEYSHPVGKPPEKGSDTKNIGANTTEHKGLPAKDTENKFLNEKKREYNATPEGKRYNAKQAWKKAKEEKKPRDEIARLKAAYDKVKNIKKSWEGWLEKMQGAGDARYGNQHLTGMEQHPVADDDSLELSPETEENNEKEDKKEDKEEEDNKPYKALSQE